VAEKSNVPIGMNFLLVSSEIKLIIEFFFNNVKRPQIHNNNKKRSLTGVKKQTSLREVSTTSATTAL